MEATDALSLLIFSDGFTSFSIWLGQCHYLIACSKGNHMILGVFSVFFILLVRKGLKRQSLRSSVLKFFHVSLLPPQHAFKFYSLANNLQIVFRCVAARTYGKVSGQRPLRTWVRDPCRVFALQFKVPWVNWQCLGPVEVAQVGICECQLNTRVGKSLCFLQMTAGSVWAYVTDIKRIWRSHGQCYAQTATWLPWKP